MLLSLNQGKAVMTRSEVWVGAAAKGIAALFSNTTQTGSRSALGKAIQILSRKNKQAIFQAACKYIDRYQYCHDQLSALGMRESIELSAVYTRVKFLDEKRSGIAIANEKPFLMVLGSPGAGKSTFLQQVGLAALRAFCHPQYSQEYPQDEPSAYRYRLIPVLLKLKGCDGNGLDLVQSIVFEFEQCAFPAAEIFTHNALAQGNLLIVLDGLDEVPRDHLDDVLRIIRYFVNRYRRNRFIVSCGTATSVYCDEAFRRFYKVTLTDFDDEQIQQFINNWFAGKQDKDFAMAGECWRLLQHPQNKDAKALAHKPQMLTYLCLLYGLSHRFPTGRSSLYRSLLRGLLKARFDDEREGLSTEQEERLLAEIAYKGMAANQPFWSSQELCVQVRTFLAHHPHELSSLDSQAVFHSLARRPGILVEHTKETYVFSYPILQAYLTAQYLVANDEWAWFIQLYLSDRRWRDVFWLLPGLMSDAAGANSLLRAMEEQSRVYLRAHQLQQLIYWAETSTQAAAQDADKQTKLAAQRMAAIFLARALTRALALVSDLDIALDLDLALDLDIALDFALARALAFARELARSLALALALDVDLDFDLDRTLCLDLDLDLNVALVLVRAGIFIEVDFAEWVRSLEALANQKPQVNASPAEKHQFIKNFDRCWFSPFGLESQWAMLSQKDSQALLDYFYVCELMIRCKEEAVQVSPEVWEGIESRILTTSIYNEAIELLGER
jgi:hypothetical protein